MKKITVEVCCGSVDDVIQAELAGAERVELNANLFHGGLTPTLGSLKAAKELTHGVKIMTMVRPREGGFCYTEAEFRAAQLDVEALLDAGADGIVFGFLSSDGTVDEARCRQMLRIIGNKESVFHRALDVVPDWRRTLDQLVDMGVTRVLTSGQEANVFFGLDTVREMREYANGRIQILPGAGITLQNARRVVDYTGCDQIHIARHKECRDTSTANNREIFFGGALYPPEDRFSVTDREYIHAVCGAVRK